MPKRFRMFAGVSGVIVLILTVMPGLMCSSYLGAEARAASGKFDLNSIDCDNLDSVPDRFRRIAERKCQENQPNFTISNKNNIADEQTPPDVYSGKDKNKLENMILDAWKTKYPEDNVLGVRFHSDSWKRDANWKSNSTGVYKTDTSVLAVSIVVKTDASVATIFPAYLNKDNLSGEIRTGVDTKKSEYIVKQMLIKNWKP